MEDKTFDEKMKDIEREIDTAIDKLFVDKTSETRPEFESAEPQEEMILEEAAINAAEEEKEGEVTEVAVETGDEGGTLQELETLKLRVEKFLEWGITGTALDNVASAIENIHQKFSDNKLIESVTHMVSDVLNFMKENPDSHLREMVDFLSGALNSLQSLVKSVEDKEINSGEVYNAINAQFSSVSSMMTFDIPQIELEEQFSMPSEEMATEETRAEEKVEERAEEEKTEEGAESYLDMALMDLKQPVEEVEDLGGGALFMEGKEAEEEREQEETVEGEEEDLEELEAPSEEEVKNLPAYSSYETFNDIVNEFSIAIKKAEKSFFHSNHVLDLTERLSTEIKSLESIVEKLTAEASADNDVRILQGTTREISHDFDTLSGLLGAKEDFTTEEIIPVIVGRKMVGFLSQSVKNIYSITQDQESRIRQKSHIQIKKEKIPFVDLFKELGETPQGADRRLLIMETPEGEKAVLVSKVMKRRFAMVLNPEEADIQKIAKFHLAEEIPLYNL